jgi:anaerobic selenocysteine-containing dehydrogenase
VLPPTGECKPFQEVIVELGSRLKLPAFTNADGSRKFKDYPDFVVNFEAQPGVGFLMGWRGKDGTEHLRGAPNPKQWEMYAKNNCVFQHHLPETMQYMRNWNRAYLDFAKDKGWRQKNDVVQLALYSDTLQIFRLAAQGKTAGRRPPPHLAGRIEHAFDPLPFWYAPLEQAATDGGRVPARRDHAAADGDVPLVGLAERVAAPDPQPQLPAREPEDRRRRRRRRRRLVLGREPVGQGPLHGALERGGRARARSGRGTRSARPTAPGSSPPAPTKRGRASSSTT